MIRVLIVDDHNLFREGLKSLLQRIPGVVVAAEASNGRDGVMLARERRPDVVIMDVTMPDLNGIDATRQIVACDPAARVLALSMHSDRQFVSQMLQAGATGYLLKDCAFDELTQALDSLASGNVYMSTQLTGIVVKDYVDRMNGGRAVKDALSPREREVLQLLAEGKTNREIAETLALGIKTAETHRKRIMEKLGMRTVAELTKYAVKQGLTRL